MLADLALNTLRRRDDAPRGACRQRKATTPATHKTLFVRLWVEEQREVVNRQDARALAPQRQFVVRAVKEIEA